MPARASVGVCFFFSSRRRHTRFDCDWSSDVCSSDLELNPPDVTIRKPPAALILRYMMTPWSGDRFTDHKIMGRVVQTLYDKAIISGQIGRASCRERV